MAELLELLGTAWSDYYGGRDQLEAYLRGVSTAWQQTHRRLADAVGAGALATCPVLHYETWRPLTIYRSQRNVVNGLPRYGAGDSTYNGDRQYGVPIQRDRFSYPCPGLQEVALICDQLGQPSVCWVHGVDFVFDPTLGLLTFQQDPFDQPFYQAPYQHADGTADRELQLWLFRAGRDRTYLSRHYGQVLGLPRASSLGYKRYLQANWNATVGGTSRAELTEFLAALLDVPVCQTDDEIVVDLTTDRQGLLILTDQHVYRAPTTATVPVQIGQKLQRGQPLSDAFTLTQFNRGQLPDAAGVTVSRNLISAPLVADLVFPNREVPLQVSYDAHDRTRVEFEIHGVPADVELFWDTVHTAGLASKTLAQVLDVRAQPEGDPTAASLPTTINPMQFLISELWRYHGCWIRLKPGSSGPQAIGLQHTGRLRAILPPRGLLLMQLDLPLLIEAPQGSLLEEVLPLQVYLEMLTEPRPVITEQPVGPPPRTIRGSCL